MSNSDTDRVLVWNDGAPYLCIAGHWAPVGPIYSYTAAVEFAQLHNLTVSRRPLDWHLARREAAKRACASILRRPR